MDDYFERIIKFPRSGLTDAMFRLIGTYYATYYIPFIVNHSFTDSKSDVSLTFGEFVEVTCTFSCFEKSELLQYFFYILDHHKTGLVEKNEVKHFVHMIWNHDINSNLKEALHYLDRVDDGDGTFSFLEILTLQEKYPSTFFPVYKLQIHIIEHSLGPIWWENHKAFLIDTRERKKAAELSALQKRQRDDARKLEAVNDEMVMKRMGYLMYHLMPWRRQAERNRIAKIAAIESELDNFNKVDKKKSATEDENDENNGGGGDGRYAPEDDSLEYSL